jgi:competence protein ComEC
MQRPIIGVTCAYSLGIALASSIQLPARVTSLLLTFLIVLALLGFTAWSRIGPRLLSALALLCFSLLGVVFYGICAHPPSPSHLANLKEDLFRDPVEVEGVICAPPERLSSGEEEVRKVRLTLGKIILLGEKSAAAARGRIRITLPEPKESFLYGERIRLPVQLRRPRGLLNPGGFCLPRYLLSQGIYLEGRVKAKEEILRLGRVGGSRALHWLYDQRQKMLRQMEAHVAAPYCGVLQGITLGDRASLDKDLQEAFIRSGTFHILAISGLNVSIVAALLYILLRLLHVPLRLRAGLTIVWVMLYALLAGASPSVVRAAVMTSLFLGALILEREADLINTLALSALLILLLNPLHLLEAGFQLTFAATLGILVVMHVFSPILTSLSRPTRWLLNSLGVSVAATLATLPILAHHFHRASLIGILANIPIVPLSGIITAAGLVYALLSLVFSSGLHWLAQLLQALIALMAHLARFFSLLPGASFPLYGPSLVMILLYYGILLAASWWRRTHWAKLVSLVCLFLLSSLIGARVYLSHHRSDLRVTFLDVGQGDSALLELPAGRTVLIDGGGSRQGEFDMGEQVVRPYLLHRWVGKLDCVVLSHPHPDHLQGLMAILRDFEVREVWEGKGAPELPLYLEFRSRLQERGIPVRTLAAGKYWNDPPLHVAVLHPSRPYLKGSPRGDFSDENNNSLVLRISFGGIRFLFPGDIEAEAEGRILGRRTYLASEVIKIPHHGGRTSSSSSFVRAVRPTYAVASAGTFNPFGHPSPEVVRRYQAARAKVLQTSQDGAIMMISGGKDLRVATELQERSRHQPLFELLGLD